MKKSNGKSALDKAAERYSDNLFGSKECPDDFKAGARWMARQIVRIAPTRTFATRTELRKVIKELVK